MNPEHSVVDHLRLVYGDILALCLGAVVLQS